MSNLLLAATVALFVFKLNWALGTNIEMKIRSSNSPIVSIPTTSLEQSSDSTGNLYRPLQCSSQVIRDKQQRRPASWHISEDWFSERWEMKTAQQSQEVSPDAAAAAAVCCSSCRSTFHSQGYSMIYNFKTTTNSENCYGFKYLFTPMDTPRWQTTVGSVITRPSSINYEHIDPHSHIPYSILHVEMFHITLPIHYPFITSYPIQKTEGKKRDRREGRLHARWAAVVTEKEKTWFLRDERLWSQENITDHQHNFGLNEVLAPQIVTAYCKLGIPNCLTSRTKCCFNRL